MTNYRPTGFHTATPYVMVRDMEAALAFYQQAFGATELMRLTRDDGSIGHAEIKFGDSPIMLGGHANIQATGSSMENLPPVSIYLYVEDVDALFAQATAAGAQSLYPVTLQPYGAHEGGLIDPFGIVWWLATVQEKEAVG
jgi:PhnB protein